MDIEQRINQLENKINILSSELNSIMNNQKKLNYNLECIIQNLINKKSQIDTNNFDMEKILKVKVIYYQLKIMLM